MMPVVNEPIENSVAMDESSIRNENEFQNQGLIDGPYNGDNQVGFFFLFSFNFVFSLSILAIYLECSDEADASVIYVGTFEANGLVNIQKMEKTDDVAGNDALNVNSGVWIFFFFNFKIEFSTAFFVEYYYYLIFCILFVEKAGARNVGADGITAGENQGIDNLNEAANSDSTKPGVLWTHFECV